MSKKRELEKKLIIAAIDWFEGKKPVNLNSYGHLINPSVNCSTEVDVKLAKSVASFQMFMRGIQ